MKAERSLWNQCSDKKEVKRAPLSAYSCSKEEPPEFTAREIYLPDGKRVLAVNSVYQHLVLVPFGLENDGKSMPVA